MISSNANSSSSSVSNELLFLIKTNNIEAIKNLLMVMWSKLMK